MHWFVGQGVHPKPRGTVFDPEVPYVPPLPRPNITEKPKKIVPCLKI